MAMKDLGDADLQGIIQQAFVESGISEYTEIEEISTVAVRSALNKSYRLIQNVNMQSRAVIGETLAQGIMTKMSPDDLKKELLSLNKSGEIQLTALRTSDGRMVSVETRAATIARTELFGIYEETKLNTAQEMMSDPLGVAQTAGDGDVRPEHKAWDGKAMTLDDWADAEDRPGLMPNCRCNLEVIEKSDYDGHIYKSLSEMGY